MIRIFTLFFLAFICATSCAQDEATELASRLRAVLDNASAMRSYDILIKHEFFAEASNSEGRIEEDSLRAFTSLCRFAVDWDKKEFVSFSKLDYSTEANSKKKQNGLIPPGKTIARTIAYQNGYIFGKIFPDRVEPFQSGLSFQDLLDSSWAVDVRSFGARLGAEGFQGLQGGFNAMLRDASLTRKMPDNGVKMSVSRSKGQIVFSSLVANGRVKYNCVFDEKTLMTKQIYQLVQEESSTTFVPYGSSSFNWEERDGIFLPVSVISEQPGAHQDYVFTKYDLYEIFWLSLNEPLDQSLFDKAALPELGTLTKHIDPNRAGAPWETASPSQKR